MSTAIAQKPKTEAAVFRKRAEDIAGSLLTEWVGEERSKEAVGRISVALTAAAAAAKDPKDFYACTAQSVATAIATSALTGIMPSIGASALAYVVPQRPRKNEQPQLQYMLSHRGLNALALRCGQQMIAVPIGKNDVLDVSPDGDTIVRSRDIDNPPMTYEELRGVVVVVRRIDSGQVICSQFVPKKLIDARKVMSRSAKSQYGPWANWPVEMSMKTAMHYAISRGWCVIDDTEATRALSAEQDVDLLETTATRTSAGAIELNAMLSGGDEPAASDEERATEHFEQKLRAAASVDDLTVIMEDVEQAQLGEEVESSLHQLAVERQEALAN